MRVRPVEDSNAASNVSSTRVGRYVRAQSVAARRALRRELSALYSRLARGRRARAWGGARVAGTRSLVRPSIAHQYGAAPLLARVFDPRDRSWH